MSYSYLKNVCVSYDNKVNVLDNLNLDIEKGELLSLLGPSGCGKSTTLRLIAGFVNIKSGEFILDNKRMNDIAVNKRNFGIVFQSYALFPHLTVFDNVAFGLKMKKMPKNDIEIKVNEMLEICELTKFKDRFPKEMSGGQRQRVALARALVIEPKLLLLDEPLSNLDAQLRIQMRNEIRRIQQKLGITAIFVTHDQEECFAISDKVAVMKDGKIEQFGTPDEIYKNPVSEYVAKFVGFKNFIKYEDYKNNFKNISILDENVNLICIRSEDIRVVENECSDFIDGEINLITFLGNKYEYNINTKIGDIVLNVDNTSKHKIGDKIKISLNNEKIIKL